MNDHIRQPARTLTASDMFKNLLLTHACKRTGTLLLAADALFFLIWTVLADQAKGHFSVDMVRAVTIALETLFIVAVGLIVLSRERIEDEYIAALRSQTIVLVIYAFFTVGLLWALCYYVSLLAGIEWNRECLVRIFFWTGFFDDLKLAVLIYAGLFQMRLWLLRRRLRAPEKRNDEE